VPTETFFLSAGSSVILFDQDSFLKHYPKFVSDKFGHAADCTSALLAWLGENLSIISIAQLAPNDVNAPIPVTTRAVSANRPRRCGRACLVSLYDYGRTGTGHSDGALIIDLKGVGASPGSKPTNKQYCTGLLSLREAFEEYFWFRIIDEVLAFSKAPFRCSSIYGIIKLGFDMVETDGRRFPAAIVFREPTIRDENTDLPRLRTEDQKQVLALELTLRQFGITSAPDARVKVLGHTPRWTLLSGCPGKHHVTPVPREAYPDRGRNLEHDELDLVNVQIGRSAIDGAKVVVDFGQYKTKKNFCLPVLSTVSDGAGGFGGVIWPDDPDFPQVSERLRLSEKLWGQSKIRTLSAVLIKLFMNNERLLNVNLKDIIDAMIKIETRKWHDHAFS
jgi:hypothetical protein